MTMKEPPSNGTLLSCMPVAVMAVVTGVDVVAGPGVGLLPLVSLGRPSPAWPGDGGVLP